MNLFYGIIYLPIEREIDVCKGRDHFQSLAKFLKSFIPNFLTTMNKSKRDFDSISYASKPRLRFSNDDIFVNICPRFPSPSFSTPSQLWEIFSNLLYFQEIVYTSNLILSFFKDLRPWQAWPIFSSSFSSKFLKLLKVDTYSNLM